MVTSEIAEFFNTVGRKLFVRNYALENFDSRFQIFILSLLGYWWCICSEVMENISRFSHTILVQFWFLSELRQVRKPIYSYHLIKIPYFSAYFHATLSLMGQYMDEFSILWGICGFFAIFLPKSYLLKRYLHK